jgi:hypothetical protein
MQAPDTTPFVLPLCHKRRRLTNPKEFRLTLFKPAPDAICPIMQEPIAQAAADGLPFLPGATALLPAMGHLTAARLPCGHDFTAVCLVYHWARNQNVLCPVCRAGHPGARLNSRRLPDPVRLPMARHIHLERVRDAAEAVEANETAARQIAEDGAAFVREAIASIPVTLILTDDEGLIVQLPCLSTINGDKVVFSAGLENSDSARASGAWRLQAIGVMGQPGMLTYLPASRWFFPHQCPANISHAHGSCQYVAEYDDNRLLKITWWIPVFLFHLFVNQHNDIFSNFSHYNRIILHDAPPSPSAHASTQ